MTSRQLELRDERMTLVVPRTDSWISVVEDVAVLAQRIAGTELVPSALRGKAPAIAASILYGREIGLPPMTALRSVYVVNGQVALKAEAMRGLILAAGHDLVFTESTSARAVARGRRKGQEEWSEVTWTIDDARNAGLTRNNTWSNYPRAMLKARATAELARDLFADVISGFVALEEVDGAEPDVHHDGTETRAPKAVTRKRTTAPRATPQGGVPGFPSTYPRNQPNAPASAAPSSSDAAEAGSVPLPGEPGYGDEVTVAITGTDEPPPPDEPPADEPRDTSAYKTYPAQRTKLHAVLSDLGVRDREVRLRLAGLVIGRTIESSNDLTRGEAGVLIDTLEKIGASQTMRQSLTAVLNDEDPVGQLDAIADRITALAAIPDRASFRDGEIPEDRELPWTPPPGEEESSPVDPWPTNT